MSIPDGYGLDPTASDLLDRLRDTYVLCTLIEWTTRAERRAFVRRIPDADRQLAVAALLEQAAARWDKPILTKREFTLWVTRLMAACPQVCDLVLYSLPLFVDGHPISGWEVEAWLAEVGTPDEPA